MSHGVAESKKNEEDNEHFAGNEKEVIVMARGDGTGPRGMGPLSGWGTDYCVENPNRVHPASFSL